MSTVGALKQTDWMSIYLVGLYTAVNNWTSYLQVVREVWSTHKVGSQRTMQSGRYWSFDFWILSLQECGPLQLLVCLSTLKGSSSMFIGPKVWHSGVKKMAFMIVKCNIGCGTRLSIEFFTAGFIVWHTFIYRENQLIRLSGARWWETRQEIVEFSFLFIGVL
jgi:hypothetical protein